VKSEILTNIKSTNPKFDSKQWNKYAVALLTDAICKKVSVGVSSSKLTSDISTYNAALMPSLSASFLVVFKSGYQPTSSALNAIVAANHLQAAADALNSAILDGMFTANINEAISQSGDSATAATWFLFNLWIALTALGFADVDTAIQSYMNAGLKVPAQVGPSKWWSGSYTSWYIPLSGSDITSKTITVDMPIRVVTSYAGSPYPTISKDEKDCGYSHSLCEWGKLNYYKS
jgi:hypothetical protein